MAMEEASTGTRTSLVAMSAAQTKTHRWWAIEEEVIPTLGPQGVQAVTEHHLGSDFAARVFSTQPTNGKTGSDRRRDMGRSNKLAEILLLSENLEQALAAILDSKPR